LPPPHHQGVLHTTRSAAETRALGRRLASHVQPGDLLCLRGELGAGKTTLIQGLAEGLGIADPVTSPSFTLVHEHAGSLPLIHIDLYRLGGSDIADIGLEEVIDSDAVVAVEWSERLPPRLARDALDIDITFDEADDDTRRIHLRARGPRAARILSSLAEATDAGSRA
jgi:tRNA threonylcarbamoyladenosine biosynthesis protein TsaE